MSEMDLEEASGSKSGTIIERQFSYNLKTKEWIWSSPKNISSRSRKVISQENLDIIKHLIGSRDLTDKIPTFPKPKSIAVTAVKPEAESDESDCDYENDDDCFIYDEDVENENNNITSTGAQNVSGPIEIAKKTQNGAKEVKIQETPAVSNTSTRPKSSIKDASESRVDSGISSTCSFSDHFTHNPESGIFWEPPKLKWGKVYLVPGTHDHRWVKAELLDVYKSLFSFVSLRSRYPIVVEHRNIAYPEPPVDPISVGCRVVALANKPAPTGEISRGKRPHRRGVVAEYPDARNKYRYLIIFEDGCWTHVKPEAVWPLDKQMSNVWEGLPDACRHIVKDYINGLYHPMVKYARGNEVKRDSDREFGVVLNVDSALVIMYFRSKNETVITHRGDKRFKLNN